MAVHLHYPHNALNLSECFWFLSGCPRPGPAVNIFRNCISANICRYNTLGLSKIFVDIRWHLDSTFTVGVSPDAEEHLEILASYWQYLLTTWHMLKDYEAPLGALGAWTGGLPVLASAVIRRGCSLKAWLLRLGGEARKMIMRFTLRDLVWCLPE